MRYSTRCFFLLIYRHIILTISIYKRRIYKIEFISMIKVWTEVCDIREKCVRKIKILIVSYIISYELDKIDPEHISIGRIVSYRKDLEHRRRRKKLRSQSSVVVECRIFGIEPFFRISRKHNKRY